MPNDTANSEVIEHANSETRSGSDEYAYATPSRKTYDSVASDVSVESAFGELVDNTLDSAALNAIDPVWVSFELEETADGEPELVYRDASGGVKKDEMGVFMGLGRSKENSAGGQNVGTFGLGAKRALKRLGDEFIIKSQHTDAETGWQYRVPSEWFDIESEEDDPNEWRFELESVDLGAGVTEIRIRDLNFNWEARKEGLAEWIGTVYQKFLQDEIDVGLSLEVEIDGMPATPPEPVEWSYSPWFDGSHPRKFTGLVFADDEWESEVQAKITVGLLRTGSAAKSGTFVFCQNRLVEGQLTDETGGFNISNATLPQYKSEQHKRLRIEIELFGNASDLPWSADKSRLQPSHKVLTPSPDKGIYWWLRRMADRHMQAGRYGAFDHTAAVFEPYGPDHEAAANGGEIEDIDVSDKQQRLRRGEVDHIRISDKPSKGYTRVKNLATVADTHAKLGIVAESMDAIGFPEWTRATYEYMVGEEFIEAFYERTEKTFADEVGRHLLPVEDTADAMETIAEDLGDDETRGDDAYPWIARHLTHVEECPEVRTWDHDEFDAEIGRLRDAASTSVGDGELRTGGPAWRMPRYRAEVLLMSGGEIDDLETVDDPIVPPERLEGGGGGPMDCPQCGVEMSDAKCPECGFEYDATEGTDGEVSTEGVNVEQAVEQAAESSGETGIVTGNEEPSEQSTRSDRLTLAEFCRKHEHLFEKPIDDLLDSEEQLEEFLIKKIQMGNAFEQAQSQIEAE